MARTHELSPGETFNRYTIVGRIGAGGMATVYEAIHRDLQKRVALKTLHPAFALRTDLVQRFVIEARAASRLAHPHVVAIYDIGVERSVPFMAMDRLEGEDLDKLIERQTSLPVERVADILLPVVSALAAAHEAGILHRDVKPENIFLAKRPPRGEHPVLLDFGVSKVDFGAPVKALTASGEVLGTPPYMAPEQAMHGMDRYDARSDQYALGVTLYLAATGKMPYWADNIHALLAAIVQGDAPPPSRWKPGIPPGFDALVMRAMAIEPADRFPTLRDLGRALLPLAGPMARALWSAEFGAGSMAMIPAMLFSASGLHAAAPFRTADDADLTRLAAIGRHARFAPGGSLFVQGARAASCFVVVSGEVELLKTYGSDTWEVGRAGPGAILGLPALWDDAPRAVSAVARAECTALEIPRDAIGRLEAACPAIVDGLLEEATAQAVQRLRRGGALGSSLGRGASPDRDTLARLAAALGEWSVAMPAQRGGTGPRGGAAPR